MSSMFFPFAQLDNNLLFRNNPALISAGKLRKFTAQQSHNTRQLCLSYWIYTI